MAIHQIRNGSTTHPIHYMFDSRVQFGGRRIVWIYVRLNQIQDAAARHPGIYEWMNERMNEYIFEMGCPSHFHEIQKSSAGTCENNVLGVRLVTFYNISC